MQPMQPLESPQPLQDGDPPRIGPYDTLSRFRETASTVQYLARSGTDGATVVVSLARPGLAALPAFRHRFEAEARTAERLSGGWVLAPVATGADGPALWTAGSYVPAITLGEAITLVGPLPERAVRTLGAGLAETLSRVHATGTVLHGLAPQTVLLAADGPRLAAFGALGAAAHAEAGPGGQLSVRLGYLTPEQLAGEKPGTASDIFVLGLLLAYAATGTTPLAGGTAIADAEPELSAVPEGLRDLVASCLAKSPAARPTAGSAAATLALEGAAALAKDGWLPEPLLTALADQAAAVSSHVEQQSQDTSAGGTPAPRSEAAPAAPVGRAFAPPHGESEPHNGSPAKDTGPATTVGTPAPEHLPPAESAPHGESAPDNRSPAKDTGPATTVGTPAPEHLPPAESAPHGES
ncbi:serine/threonine protein kinase, partial [Streptomyces sp. NPDC054841]